MFLPGFRRISIRKMAGEHVGVRSGVASIGLTLFQQW